jgi:hypothetical protein
MRLDLAGPLVTAPKGGLRGHDQEVGRERRLGLESAAGRSTTPATVETTKSGSGLREAPSLPVHMEQGRCFYG